MSLVLGLFLARALCRSCSYSLVLSLSLALSVARAFRRSLSLSLVLLLARARFVARALCRSCSSSLVLFVARSLSRGMRGTLLLLPLGLCLRSDLYKKKKTLRFLSHF